MLQRLQMTQDSLYGRLHNASGSGRQHAGATGIGGGTCRQPNKTRRWCRWIFAASTTMPKSPPIAWSATTRMGVPTSATGVIAARCCAAMTARSSTKRLCSVKRACVVSARRPLAGAAPGRKRRRNARRLRFPGDAQMTGETSPRKRRPALTREPYGSMPGGVWRHAYPNCVGSHRASRRSDPRQRKRCRLVLQGCIRTRVDAMNNLSPQPVVERALPAVVTVIMMLTDYGRR